MGQSNLGQIEWRSAFFGATFGRLACPTSWKLDEAPMIKLLLWLILLCLCWPLAILALLLWPIAWLICLPFRLLGIAVTGVFDLLSAIIHLPARLLGAPPRRA